MPGQSGNPDGRPKIAGEVRELARQHTAAAIEALVAALAVPATRVPAAVALLERGWGKPTQPVVGDPDVPLRFVIYGEREAKDSAAWQAQHVPAVAPNLAIR